MEIPVKLQAASSRTPSLLTQVDKSFRERSQSFRHRSQGGQKDFNNFRDGFSYGTDQGISQHRSPLE
jgi:hypothetical protein